MDSRNPSGPGRLSDRRNPTPCDPAIPGAIDGARIVERRKATEPSCVVYNPGMHPRFAPFDPLFPEVAERLASDSRRAAVVPGPGTEGYGLVRRGKRGP